MKKAREALLAGALLLVSLAGHAGPPLPVSAEDQRQILDLIAAYSYTYDGKDLEGYLALHIKDCVWELVPRGSAMPSVRAGNRDELGALASQRWAMLQKQGIQSRHYQTNTLLSASEGGQVEGRTMLNLVWQAPGQKPFTVTTGVYSDVFVKADGGWKFAKRTLLMDQAELSK
jgi:3-phenylpropionate/cinnamic acid dioxygenase small subunit